MRDASLDEFLTGGDEGGESEEHGTDANGREAGDDPETERAEPEPEPESGDERGSESEPDDAGTDEAGGSEADEGPPPTADVEPARSTYAWSPEGAACAACGERVEERWEDEAGLVCVACKEW